MPTREQGRLFQIYVCVSTFETTTYCNVCRDVTQLTLLASGLAMSAEVQHSTEADGRTFARCRDGERQLQDPWH